MGKKKNIIYRSGLFSPLTKLPGRFKFFQNERTLNPMEARIAQLKDEIERLKDEKSDREKALPAHSIRPHQLLVIEELEEEIDRKQKELEALTDIF
jgi:sensor histidine kinase YesM